ncbi:hypothetical protein [Natrinema sp. J7-1]|uniref:hypothetical protein n=1 Tax=Natrinema sp. J7-1 TaxID=1172566 RepID=UPI0009DF8E02|nr:hypothetical protein [Natrinema sp. J7-1]
MKPSPNNDFTQQRDDRSDDVSIARRSVLRAGAGLATPAVGITALSGQVAAHFPTGLEVDIKPGSEKNPINPTSHGTIPVAVLQTDEFDPTSEAVRYRFGAPDVVAEGGGARPAHGGHIEDVDGDGQDDLVLHFPTDETRFDGDESEGRLEWERTEEGAHGLAGTDTVTIVGRGPQ